MTSNELRNLFITELNAPKEKLDLLSNKDSLMQLGILDSLNMLKLISLLEQKYNFTINLNMIQSSDLTTIDGLVRLIGDEKKHV